MTRIGTLVQMLEPGHPDAKCPKLGGTCEAVRGHDYDCASMTEAVVIWRQRNALLLALEAEHHQEDSPARPHHPGCGTCALIARAKAYATPELPPPSSPEGA